MHRLTCSRCGAERPSELTADAVCPKCGGTGVTTEVTLSDPIGTSEALVAELTPVDQDRDWKRRWLEAVRELGELLCSTH